MYITWNDLVLRYPDVAKDGKGSAVVNTAAIMGAEADLNGRFANLYTVPFTPCPDIIKDLALDVAYYKLSWRQKNIKPLKDYIDERITAIVNGTLLLVDPTTGVPLQKGDLGVWTDHNYKSAFGPDDPVNWNVDSSWIQAAQDERAT